VTRFIEGDYIGSFSIAHRDFSNVRNVPIAASHGTILSVSFRDNRRSDSVDQGPFGAHSGPP
jgi:hypothetical protein